MGNLIVFFSKNKDILKIVSKYKELYKADIYEIETLEKINILDKLLSTNINIKRCDINLNSYNNIILISPLWFNKVPNPVIKFLNQQTGKINNISYILYNNNHKDYPKEFNKLDKILNLRRDKSYFVNVVKDNIKVRVYQ